MHARAERIKRGETERQACSVRNENWKGENNKNLEELLTQQRVSKNW